MAKILASTIGIFCTGTVITLLLAMGMFWQQGTLNEESVQEIQTILSGAPREIAAPIDPETAWKAKYEEIVQERTGRILNIARREDELDLIKTALEKQSEQVVEERKKIEQSRAQFRLKLEEAKQEIVSEAAEQSRGILLKLPVEDAAEELMALDLKDAIILVKGMTEKDAAKILSEYRNPGRGGPEQTPLRMKRAMDIFQAIYGGQPVANVVDNAAQTVAPANQPKPEG